MKTNTIQKISFIVLVCAALMAISGNDAKAQGQFSGGLELGLPLGTFGDFAGIGFGLSGRYQAPIQDKLNWTVNAGFLSFSGKDISLGGFGTIKASSTTIIPITGGVQYYFTESNNGLYAGADLGFYIASSASSETRFGFAPGLGYRTGNLDFNFKFNIVSDINFLNIRAAYVFGGK
jgi:hypothetical protein